MVMHVKPIKVNKQQCGCVCDIDSSHTRKEHLISLWSVLAAKPSPGNANLENKNMAQMSQQSSQLAKDGLSLIIF